MFRYIVCPNLAARSRLIEFGTFGYFQQRWGLHVSAHRLHLRAHNEGRPSPTTRVQGSSVLSSGADL